MELNVFEILINLNKDYLGQLGKDDLEKELEIIKNQCELGKELGFTRQEIIDFNMYSCLKA